MRKARVDPSVSRYLEALAKDQPLDLVLRGHLVIEALLVEIIQLFEASDRPWRWNFPQKVDTCVTRGLVDLRVGALCKRVNDIRNDFAHVLGHTATFDDVFDLACEAARAGCDFSDETVFEDRALSEEWYGIDGVLTEILNSLYFVLAETLYKHGGAERLGG